MENHSSIVKEFIIQLLNDLLNLNLKSDTIFHINTGLIIINNINSKKLTEQISEKLIDLNIDELKDSEILFNTIFLTFGKDSQFIEPTIKDIYFNLSENNKSTIVQYAKLIQSHCKGYKLLNDNNK